jgi:uncharacterized protein YjbJ (UPF0337 family)
MNQSTLKGNWNEIKGKIRQKWGKLTDSDLDMAQGNLEEVVGKLQQAYGYSKDKAWEEFNEFKQSLFSEDSKAS